MKRIASFGLLLCGAAGLLTLASFYAAAPEVVAVRQLFLRGVTLLIAAVTFLRVLDFLRFQVRELGERNANFLHRFTTLTVFTVILIIGLTKQFDHPGLQSVLLTLRRSIEPVCAGMICLSLIYGLFVTAKSRPNLFRTTFLISAAVFLILFSGVFDRFALPEPVEKALSFMISLPTGAVTGLLIGLAIGAIVSSVRVLFFANAPAGENRRYGERE